MTASSASRAALRRLHLGHVVVDAVRFDEALDRIEALVAARRGGSVFTPNVDHVVLAERNRDFRAAYAEADLALADGMPLLWAARLLGAPLPAKVSGSDLVEPLAERAATRGWRLYLLGGGAGVAADAAARLQARFPGVNVVGVDAPRIGADGSDGGAALARLRAARPDLVMVALGAPKQELWIHRHREALAPAVAVGVGGSLDFIAGRVRRAPRWASRAGLEWAWRLAREPRRLWRRYLVEDLRFAPILVRELRARRGDGAGAGAPSS